MQPTRQGLESTEDLRENSTRDEPMSTYHYLLGQAGRTTQRRSSTPAPTFGEFDLRFRFFAFMYITRRRRDERHAEFTIEQSRTD